MPPRRAGVERQDDRTRSHTPRQPRREQRTLAHARPAGDRHPAIQLAIDQELVEPPQLPRAPDELLVPLPLHAVVESDPGHPRQAP